MLSLTWSTSWSRFLPNAVFIYHVPSWLCDILTNPLPQNDEVYSKWRHETVKTGHLSIWFYLLVEIILLVANISIIVLHKWWTPVFSLCIIPLFSRHGVLPSPKHVAVCTQQWSVKWSTDQQFWSVIGSINSSPPGQNGRHFADNLFKCIFVNEKFCISIRISLKFVPKGPINNKSALVQVMAWRQTSDKPLPEPMMTQFTDAFICGTRGSWVNSSLPGLGPSYLDHAYDNFKNTFLKKKTSEFLDHRILIYGSY